MTVLTDRGKAKQGSLQDPCTRRTPGAGLFRAARPFLPPGGLGPLGPPVFASPSASWILTMRVLHRVLLGTFLGTSAGLFPAAQKAHAQGCAPGNTSFSQKRGLGSQSVPCSGSRSLTLQWVGRASTVRQATRGTEGAGRGEELRSGPRRGRM